jgi:bacteriocin biosynthesis cyclodehydratase domain-containing protein
VRTARVACVGQAHAGDTVARLLLRAGVRNVALLGWTDAADAAGLDLVLAFPSPQELPQLDDWNRRMLERRTPWLQTLPFDGRMAAVGPLFVPGETCCHSCYQLRRAATSDYRSEFWTLARTPAHHPAPPALTAVAAGAAALLALRWLAWRDPLAPGKIQAIELGAGLELAVHHVYRVPRCPVCSGLSDLAPPLPWFKEEAGVGG